VQEFLQHTINGLSLGAIYALIALGYTMVYGILKFINFAHGEVFMLGAYTGFYVGRAAMGEDPSQPKQQGLIFFLGVLLIAMLVTGLIGFLVERLCYRPLRNAPRINVLITAVGVSLLFQFGAQMIFGPNPRPFPPLMNVENAIQIGGVSVDAIQLIVMAVALALMLLLQFILFRTQYGRAMRAVSHSHETAMLLGIPVDRVISLTFIIGSALAGAAGILVGLAYPKIEPLMGLMPGLKAFVAAVLGGIGNVPGAVVGALLMGLSEQYIVAYGAPTFRDALAFAILIGILVFRPAGLFGKSVTEKV
jgi:branched-chain amino acid transport system permease protein